ncbi:transcription factor [Moesziomyces antarcticus T-34]|uniref:Protein CASP n=1 Tax=Pseudozyma antarctica (strain T-34) TaxID=1151754 RepID=M9LXD7_PSEA3|nr:transcription factor [Moesziomyces antarcticus T-34]
MATASASAPLPYTVDGAGPSRQPVDFNAALSTWRDINLVELQSQLNTLAPELLQAQTAAVANRKKLADQTREFKKQPDANKLESFKPLLKAYQSEIDTLTKRSKAAENAFLNVHSALGSAPDPYPLLEVTLEQAASLNDLESLKQANAKLTRDLAQHQSRSDAAKAQDTENARLQQRIRALEQDFDARLKQSTAALERELSAKWDERIRNLNEREADLTKSLNLAQEQLQHLKSKDDSATAQLLGSTHPDDLDDADPAQRNGKANLAAEVELLSRDLERAHARVESVERRNEQLRAEVESVKSGRQESDKLSLLEAESQQKDRNLVQLQASLEHERQRAAELSAQLDSSRQAQRKQITEKDAEIESLRTKLHQRSDYADIKRELDIVKAIHFSAEDDEESPNADDKGTTLASASAPSPSLEALLLDKNKRLEDQLATLRVANTELSASLNKAASNVASLTTELAQTKTLNQRLEADLVSVGRDNRENRSGAKATAALSAEDALRQIESLEAEVSQTHTAKSRASTSARAVPRSAEATTTSSGGDSSILTIVTSQRDRFRSRNAELEEELRSQFDTISELRAEIKTLQSDNLALYEKMRYLQSFSGRQQGGGGARSEAVIQMGSGGTDASGAYPPARTGGDDKYRAKYEEAMNPFAAFRGREQTRAMAQLNPLERALHVLTRLVVSHRRMRVVFMAYAIGLHLLVLGMLFEVSATSSAQTCSVPH